MRYEGEDLDPLQGYMALGTSDMEPADKVMWNMTGPEVYEILGNMLRTDPEYKYQIMFREVKPDE